MSVTSLAGNLRRVACGWLDVDKVQAKGDARLLLKLHKSVGHARVFERVGVAKEMRGINFSGTLHFP